MSARLLPVVLLCVAAAYVMAAVEIPMDPWTAAEAINTRTLPIVYGTLLAGACLWLLVRPPAASAAVNAHWLRLLGSLVLVIATLALLEKMSFWIALGALLCLLSLWLGERRAPTLVLVSIAVPLLGWLGVEVLLGLRLPS